MVVLDLLSERDIPVLFSGFPPFDRSIEGSTCSPSHSLLQKLVLIPIWFAEFHVHDVPPSKPATCKLFIPTALAVKVEKQTHLRRDGLLLHFHAKTVEESFNFRAEKGLTNPISKPVDEAEVHKPNHCKGGNDGDSDGHGVLQ